MTEKEILFEGKPGLNEFVLQVFDANGKCVVEQSIRGFQIGDGMQLNTQRLENGVYTVMVKGETFVAHKKLIVQN